MVSEIVDGITNRLVTFADVKDVAFGSKHAVVPRFWIEARSRAMKLYVAGNGKSPGSAQRDFDTGTRNRLLSYAFLDDWAKDEFEFWVHARPQDVSVFLDSGAFSAFTLGKRIVLAEYCDYVREHCSALAAYAVLDVIGDEHGTERNLQEMRRQGLDPVSIYHADREGLDVLRRLLDGSQYVALGGMVGTGMTKDDLARQLDASWRLIEKHWPVRVHGLGLMAPWALERYPFYSTDSSSAIVAAGMGRVTRFERGTLQSDGWKEDVKCTLDGAVADGIGRVATAERKSNSAHEGRRIRNIQAQLAFERYITDLWTLRGVTWQ